ncbi:unnamed protein product [Brachionus calyciflorus]|uniref:Peptidase metallopeptidase domain-containing protein n=1 Tax=Brachionus calyciflorus TaxID=104777 RepID=A0A813RDJ4_9BILA|nr:unnamed protein product [Brachionus calyciflorus]
MNKRSIVASRYVPKRALWNKYILSYSLDGNVSDKNQTSFLAVKKALFDAFHDWEMNSCFDFIDVTPSQKSDIKILFTNDKINHKDCNRKFRGTAAHAFYRYHKKFPAHIHINNEIFWMESKKPSGSISLKTVLLHEIGHVLGLYHSDDQKSVMLVLEKQLMLFGYLSILVILFKCENVGEFKVDDSEWKCTDMDTAKLEFKVSDKFKSEIEIFYQYDICNKCDLIGLKRINPSINEESSVIIDSYYGYVFNVSSISNKISICQNLKYKNFGECGVYSLEINDINDCSIKRLQNPKRPNVWLLLGVLIIACFVLICNLIEKKEKKLREFLIRIVRSSRVKNLEDINVNELEEVIVPEQVKVKNRLHSLDTFRGISLFLMIFVNYGSGGYKFLQHVPWHGITLADFVFPWFLWIMGFSIPLSTNSLLKKYPTKRLKIFKKILIRTLKMFFIGIMLNSRFGVMLENLRIFGVLQRIAICYFVVATLELFLYKDIKIDDSKKGWKLFLSDVIWSKFHFIFVILIAITWILLSYLITVPGCPKGYMGPGGLDQGGVYYNCTGGIAGYFDKIIFGKSHLYQRPTVQKIYKTTEPFDPEGFFGIFNSVVLTYLGVHAGRITIFYKNQKTQIILWCLWGVLCFILYSALTQFDMTNGWIPVNKNLWTLTYSLITGCSSYLIFAFLFVIIDVKPYWSGNPFIYLGMNSILFYVCHSVFATTFPCQWIVSNKHLPKLLMNIWGAFFWTLMSIYFYKKKWFFNL